MILRPLFVVAFGLVSHAATQVSNSSGLQLGSTQQPLSDAAYKRKVFYVGGDYNTTNSGNVLQNQVYIEQLTPAAGKTKSYPLVMLHGGDISGLVWLNKPDNGTGWASYFLNQGFEVFIVDEWSVGRSGPESTAYTSTDGAGASYELAELAFSAPQLYNKYYQSKFHTQWPGNGTEGDPVFDNFYSTFGPVTIGPQAETIMQAAMCDLLQRIGPAVFVAHSIGSQYALLASDACPDRVLAHVAVEGDQTPFGSYDNAANGANTSIPFRPYGIANIPLNYTPAVTNASQLVRATVGSTKYTDGLLSNFSCTLQAETPPPRQLPNIAQVPQLFLVSEASIHITYDHCQVSYLQQAGVNVTFTHLADVGIKGNGHFMMLEKNSDDIAAYINQWISRTV